MNGFEDIYAYKRYVAGEAPGAGNGVGGDYCDGWWNYVDNFLSGTSDYGQGHGCGIAASCDAHNGQWREARNPPSPQIAPQIEARMPIKVITANQAILSTAVETAEGL